MRCAEKTEDPHVTRCLYNYYMLTEQMDKVRQLVQVCYDISVTTSLFDVVGYCRSVIEIDVGSVE